VLAPALVVAALGCREDAESPTAPEAEPALKTTQAQALSFREVSAGVLHTCGVTLDKRAYCWGLNSNGQLGDGTTDQRLRPVRVALALPFRQVSAGFHTCGVTTDDRVYCWGNNDFGQLGDGTTGQRLTPVPVQAGGLRFRQVSAGFFHTCGVTTSNEAFCWGRHSFGQLGDGTPVGPGDVVRLTPVAVAGGLRFRQVSAGGVHTCGVTTDDRAYCWGGNHFGQLGNLGGGASPRPVAVAGGLRFREVSAGAPYTCGVTTDDRVYCWGNNDFGQLGDGTTTERLSPTAVAGGHRFRQLSAGGDHTCAANRFDRIFCWGANDVGQLGHNPTTSRLRPVRVVGPLRFGPVSAGGSHTCGVTIDNLAYCWGANFNGQLGDGTLENRRRPTPVAGPM
jgi:alpha-tubulin suppressor-like RCC1 family protein